MAVTKIDITRQGQFSGDTSLSSHKLTNVLDPTLAQDVATKNYVDTLAQGLSAKLSVRVATTAALGANTYANGTSGVGATLVATSNASLVIDGVTVVAGDRVLVQNEVAPANNGIYIVTNAGSAGAAYTLTRATNADTGAEQPGAYTFVEAGTVNGGAGFTVASNGPFTMGATAIPWTQFSGAGEVTTGNVLTKSGNQLSVAAMATGTVILGNAGVPTVTAVSGDVTIGSTGTTTIGANTVSLAKMATLAPNTVIGNATGAGATPTAVPMVSTPTASAVAIRDTNANMRVNNLIESISTTATAASTTTLTVGSNYSQQFTGTSTQTVVLPDATTLVPGQAYAVYNRSTGIVTVNANGGGLLQTMASNSQTILTAVTTGTTAGTWDSAYSTVAGGTGTVTAVSVVTANGLAGISSGGATPALTLSTTITGLLKGNGTAISAAVAGTDYLTSANFVDDETPAGVINGSTTAFTLANTPVAGTVKLFLNGLRQKVTNDYTISGTAITYLAAPLTGDTLTADYRK